MAKRGGTKFYEMKSIGIYFQNKINELTVTLTDHRFFFQKASCLFDERQLADNQFITFLILFYIYSNEIMLKMDKTLILVLNK